MLKKIDIQSFRNIKKASITFVPGLNLFWGENGSGKSSILEAIHFIAKGRSFRTNKFTDAVNHQSGDFVLRSSLSNGRVLALQKGEGSNLAKLDGKAASMAALAKHLPMLFMDSNSHRSYFGEAAYRRRFIDWAAFHVEPGYISIYREYCKALRMRNAALKVRAGWQPWDHILVATGEQIIAARERTVLLLQEGLLSQGEGRLLQYLPSINAVGIEEGFRAGVSHDLQAGTTLKGPHRDDFQFMCGGRSLSQGQQKLAYIHLLLAAHDIMSQKCESVLVVFDDVCAEMGSGPRNEIVSSVRTKGGQAIITGVLERDLREMQGDRLFHVEQGCVK